MLPLYFLRGTDMTANGMRQDPENGEQVNDGLEVGSCLRCSVRHSWVRRVPGEPRRQFLRSTVSRRW